MSEVLRQRRDVLPRRVGGRPPECKAEGIDLSDSPVKTIVVAGEPGGSIPATRRRLEEAWPGATVFDHHGMTEVGPVTYQCPAQPGILHVLEQAYLPEIIDPDTGEPVENGATGELILTTLGRHGSPLLRYRTGDLVKAISDQPCACGRHDLGLDGGILGRADDMVVVRGVNVYPSAVEEIVRSVGGVAEYRVEINQADTLTEMSVEVEPEAADYENLAKRLAIAFQENLSLRVPIRLAEPKGAIKPVRKHERPQPSIASIFSRHAIAGRACAAL